MQQTATLPPRRPPPPTQAPRVPDAVRTSCERGEQALAHLKAGPSAPGTYPRARGDDDPHECPDRLVDIRRKRQARHRAPTWAASTTPAPAIGTLVEVETGEDWLAGCRVADVADTSVGVRIRAEQVNGTDFRTVGPERVRPIS